MEYDPNRTAKIALVHYADGEKRYIIAPLDLKVGDRISCWSEASIKAGNALPVKDIPVGTVVNNVELTPGRGGQIARGAGTGAIVQAKEGTYVHLKLPSGEVRKIHEKCMATVGNLSNIDWKNEVFWKSWKKKKYGN